MIPAKKPWWKEYRKRQYKLRKKMAIEMIIRKSLLEVLKEYIDHCSISGVKTVCDPKLGWKQRIIRIWIFCIMLSLVCYFLYFTWFETLANPLIVTSESSTYPIQNIDFPAVAICNANRISKKALKTHAKEIHPELALNNETLEEVERFFKNFRRLIDFSYDASWDRHAFLDVISKKYDTTTTLSVMQTLAPSCSEMLVRCTWQVKRMDCLTIFDVRRTARGHCCVFNYVREYNSSREQKKSIAEAKRQVLPGFPYGLNVILDPLLDDYAYANEFKGFDIFLFDPTHFADLSAGRLIHRLVEPNMAVFMELNSIKQIASSEVRKYPTKTRKCLFKDELQAEYNGMYSYSACIVGCRVRSVQSLCKCTPYFLPIGNGSGPICTMEDLKCLNKYKEKLLYIYPEGADKTDGLELELEDSLYCPDCLPDCELTQHFTKSYGMSITTLTDKKYYIHKFMDNLNMSGKLLLSVHHAVADGVLERLDVVAYWFEVLSNIGGFGGVLVGFSVFSVVEIVYFLIVRFIFIIRSNYIEYH